MSTAIAPAPRPFAVPAGPWVGFVAVLALFVLLIGIKGELGTYLSTGNLRVLLHEGTVPAIVGLGMLLVLISGGIDLSVGAVRALVAAGVAVGGVCGLVNGLLVTRLKLQPFVATLGMFGIARGLAVWLAGRTTLAFPVGGRPGWVESLS